MQRYIWLPTVLVSMGSVHQSVLGNQSFLNIFQEGFEEIMCHGLSAYPQPQ